MSAPAWAISSSKYSTVTVTVSESVLPRSSVAVIIYVVVASGLAVGFSAVVLERPSAGVHSIVIGATPPVTVGSPPSAVNSPNHIVASSPASTLSSSYASTVTTTVSDAVLPR